MAEQTAFSSICDLSSNFRLFARSSFKNLIAFGICESTSLNASSQGLAFSPVGMVVAESLEGVVCTKSEIEYMKCITYAAKVLCLDK
ncbi:hypothetical protein GOBAR_AA21215 [Gossypium barbadense]|uniref:Uncharacterized protein n=1 Tax=Gossypium barbadense TaxID=3634 RepID=A0A2P5X7Y6_GOSBA|nr:hypothetical protein GOBAR_AA21215 [Gossypium barbadense]